VLPPVEKCSSPPPPVGAAIPPPILQIAPIAPISGRVLLAGAAVTGAKVDVFQGGYQGGRTSLYGLVASATTDDTGAYSINVALGAYRLFAAVTTPGSSSLAGYAWYGGVITFGTSPDVTVASTGTQGIDIRLFPVRAISGTVSSARGSPAGITVIAFCGGTRPELDISASTTDSSGKYRLSVIPGTYRIRIQPSARMGLLGRWYGDVAQWQQARNVVVEDRDLAIDVTLPAGNFLAGTVRAADGSLLTGGAFVYLKVVAASFSCDDGSFACSTQVDNTGTFLLTVPSGSYQLEIQPGAASTVRVRYPESGSLDVSGDRILDIRLASVPRPP
jgi:hypothetical protein